MTDEDASELTNTHYLGGFQYTEDHLDFFLQNDPVQAKLATEHLEWKHSSGRNYSESNATIEIDDSDFLGSQLVGPLYLGSLFDG